MPRHFYLPLVEPGVYIKPKGIQVKKTIPIGMVFLHIRGSAPVVNDEHIELLPAAEFLGCNEQMLFQFFCRLLGG